MRLKVAVIVGTRPEAIKMAPVLAALRDSSLLSPVLVSTGQHRELLDNALRPFGLVPDAELNVMAPNQTLNQLSGRVIESLAPLFETLQPHAVLVQGDTTTVFCASLAAYHLHIPIGHVEAGLRTYDHEHPFPEEANRQLTARLARWCFAPTELARQNLISERIPTDRILVTGNTVIDALLWAVGRTTYRCRPGTLLVTLHRRESFGQCLLDILLGVRDFLEQEPTAHVLWPVHPNPRVQEAAEAVLFDSARVHRVKPLDYLDFAGALATCRMVLTDSGGLQEEGPSLGKPVLVARETTERPEALQSGLNRLVGRSREGVASALLRAWADPCYEGPIPAESPFGDGRAASRIVAKLEADLCRAT